MKQPLNEEFKRMQKLAGILNEEINKIESTRAQTWHANYSEALDAALEFGKSQGYTYIDDEINDIKQTEKRTKVFPEPLNNSSNIFKLALNKDGKETNKMLEIQIYNAGDKDPKEKYTLSCSIYTNSGSPIYRPIKNI